MTTCAKLPEKGMDISMDSTDLPITIVRFDADGNPFTTQIEPGQNAVLIELTTFQRGNGTAPQISLVHGIPIRAIRFQLRGTLVLGNVMSIVQNKQGDVDITIDGALISRL